jgi:hypothetical protein
MDMYKQGQNLAAQWKTPLEELKEQIECRDEALLGSIVALACIHLNLSFVFKEVFEEAGYQGELDFNTSFDTLLENKEKWLCIVIPGGENAAALQVQAPGLSDDRRLSMEMTQSSFVQFIKTLDEKGVCLPYQRGVDLLYNMGHTFTNNQPLHIPFMHWQELKEKWPLFYAVGETLREPLKKIAVEFIGSKSNQDAISAYNDLAAGLWAALQELNILNCGQSKKKFFSFLRRGSRQEKFLGQAAYYGDHQEFWDFVLDYRKERE